MDWYSKLVATLKVLLPLVALGLLSTLFLLSRSVDPLTTIAFADADIKDRIARQRITAPFFSGATETGDSLSFSAAELGTSINGQNEASDVFAQIDLRGGTRIIVVSDSGKFDLGRRISDLNGNVIITTSTGFRISSDALRTNLDNGTLVSPGPVAADSPFGTIDSGQMALTSSRNNGPAQLIFTNGVKLVYDPKQTTE